MIELEYYQKIDFWVSKAIDLEVHSFPELLLNLPGVDPIMAKLSLERLRNSYGGAQIEKLLNDSISEVPAPPRLRYNQNDVVPHPLDFDWRFTGYSIKSFVERICLSVRANKVLLLGAPSIALALEEVISGKDVTLIDQNACWEGKFDHVKFVHGDITSQRFESLSLSEYDLVIIDPPWYTHQFHAFMRFASRALNIGGFLLFASPSEGTRPGILREREDLDIFGRGVGLDFYGEEKNIITYETPPFEFNAFKASGINYFGTDWRRSDLLMYKKVGVCETPFSLYMASTDWKEINIQGVRVKFKCGSNENSDFKFESILSGDILPSVSIRHPLRDRATVWTSGNRIFECSAPMTLYQLLNTKQLGSPCASTSTEIFAALDLIRSVVRTELDEYINIDS